MPTWACGGSSLAGQVVAYLGADFTDFWLCGGSALDLESVGSAYRVIPTLGERFTMTILSIRKLATLRALMLGVLVLSLTVSPLPAYASNAKPSKKTGKSSSLKSPKTQPATTSKSPKNQSAVDPNAPEVLSPGDIPDDIAFVPYSPNAAGFTVTAPEGWSRKETANGAIFTDKYNIIQIDWRATTQAPTPSSVALAVKANLNVSKGFKFLSATTVKRTAGNAVLVTYLVGSAPNEVTGKSIPVAVERYEFFKNGKSVVLTLSGAKGADNVDPWRIVTNSFAWA